MALRMRSTNASAQSPQTIRTTEQPRALPTLRWRPERVRGIPVALEILVFTPDMPSALFHENENPYFFFLLMLHAPFYFRGRPTSASTQTAMCNPYGFNNWLKPCVFPG